MLSRDQPDFPELYILIGLTMADMQQFNKF